MCIRDRYRPAVWLIAPMVSGTLFRFYSYSYSALQNYYKRTQYVAAGTIGTMVLNVILNYVCILNFGYMAAAYTTAFSYIILLLVQGILEHKITGMVIVPPVSYTHLDVYKRQCQRCEDT